jgi:hypothetical protein
MNEATKTLVFVILAALLAGAAVLSRPVIQEVKVEEMVGKPLFPKFTDPLGVKTLEIIKHNAGGDRDDFKIAEVGGVWSIPSHDNYPADAKDQMGKVAEALVDLTVLDVVASQSDAQTLQTMYGVIDPTSENASLGEGVGLKVALGGVNNEPLVDLIIGKVVESGTAVNDPASENDTAKLRYVRVAGQSPIYVAKIDPSRFSTSFDQWIEKNLLDISTLDVKQVYVDMYSFSVEVGLTQDGLQESLAPTFLGDMTLAYNGSGSGAEKWNLNRWMGFRGQNYEYYERKLDGSRELNTDTLDSMISALNDLKIVSVTRKPTELALALREGKPFEKIKMDASMKKSGFYLVEIPDLKLDPAKSLLKLLSNEGDIQLRMKDGIRYNLRFGALTGTESEVTADNKDSEDEAKPDMGQNRYLFVTAEFDPAMIPQPEVKPVPEIPTEGKPEEIDNFKKEKEAVEKENQREKERYDAEIESGKKRVEKLSARFADWYYVIPEDVYKKIHLTENNLFRDKKPGDVPPAELMTPPAETPVEIPAAEPAKPVKEFPELPGTENIQQDGETKTNENEPPARS